MPEMPRRLKTGKNALDIFSPTFPAPPQEPAPQPEPTVKEAAEPEPASVGVPTEPSARPGRPATHEENWSKVTVVLLNRQVVFLDRLAATIRERTGSTVKRAEIIRALVDTLAEGKLDITQATSESEIKSTLLRQIAS